MSDLEKHGHLVRVKEEISPYLEMSAVHLRMFEKNGPAVLFEKVIGSRYRALSNLFGDLERSKFIFRENFISVKELIRLRNNPLQAIKNPFKYGSTAVKALNALPKKSSFPRHQFEEIKISDLP